MNKQKIFKNLSLLYAEDDKELCLVTEKTLSMLVGQVFSARSGSEALSIYQNSRVDAVILDIYMGDISGLEVAKEIRKNDPKIPIIILSGSVQTDDLLEACKLKLVDYIPKPIELSVLIQVLSKTVEQLQSEGMLLSVITQGVTYDRSARSLVKENEVIPLTKNEIDAIELLLRRRGQVVTYDEFYKIFDETMSDGALKNMILRLRKKIGDENSIRNHAKIGYSII